MNLPALDFDEDGNIRLSGCNISQGTFNNQSQYSPVDRSASFEGSYDLNLNIRRSSSEQGSHKLASPFGKSPNAPKPDDDIMPMIFGEEEELPFGDFGLAIDADGNVIEEPDLPPHRPSQPDQVDGPAEPGSRAPNPLLQDDEGIRFDDDGDMQMNFGEEPLPDAEALPARQRPEGEESPEQVLSSESAAHPAQRKPRRIKQLAPDSATHISRDEFKGWSENYLDRMEADRRRPVTITAAQSRKNGYFLTYGIGLGGIGLPTGIPGYAHPLAEYFAGEALRKRILGKRDKDEDPHGRRRSASAAFEEEPEEERRVRPRLDGEEQPGQGRSQVDIPEEEGLVFAKDVEVGREGQVPLSDRASSVPWNRPPSVVPSSARSNKANSALQSGRQVEGSPLVGRGSILPIERFSDNMQFGSDGAGPAEQPSSFSEFGAAAGVNTQDANTSQFMRDALDREGRNFLGFMERVATDRGIDDAVEDRRWVEFDGLFEQQDKTKVVVAQAFLHVLTLATKGQIKLKQEGAKQKIPFGEIRVGIQGPFEEVVVGEEAAAGGEDVEMGQEEAEVADE